MKASDPPLREVQLAGGRACYTDEGQGPVVVAIHGYPGGPRDYRYLGALLEPRCRFVRIAMPGQDHTPLATAPELSLEGSVGYIRSVLDALELDPIVLVGHSLGGALATASCDARVRAMALLAPVSLRPHQGYRRWKPVLQARLIRPKLGWALMKPFTVRLFRSVGFRRSSPEAIRNGTLLAASMADAFGSMEARFRALPTPTLLAWARDDELIEPAIFEELEAVLPAGPRLRWAEGGHNVQKSHAEELAEAILELAEGEDPHP